MWGGDGDLVLPSRFVVSRSDAENKIFMLRRRDWCDVRSELHSLSEVRAGHSSWAEFQDFKASSSSNLPQLRAWLAVHRIFLRLKLLLIEVALTWGDQLSAEASSNGLESCWKQHIRQSPSLFIDSEKIVSRSHWIWTVLFIFTFTTPLMYHTSFSSLLVQSKQHLHCLLYTVSFR